jgi:hypothetical protein
VPAGVVHHRRARKRETYPLAELGALAVVKQPPKERYGRRGPQATVWELRAERVQRPLAESMSREAVEERSAMLAGLVLNSAVRGVLVAPSGEGALRSAPDEVGEVRRIAGERAGEVLSALERDPDREVAARAAQVRARLG